MKDLIDTIRNCDICEGTGMTDCWASQDGDFDFEWCDCNPHHISMEVFA